MITMHELVDLRMQQHIAHEIYRQQIMQRIPDPFPPLMPLAALQPPMMMPSHPPLPDVEAKLENDDLWQQFHKIGTEMIITKTGRRMFPSTRLSLSGLEDESSYCVLLEMVPIGDCRYKFSGSQWVPAGGAEPQSPQRMYLHPDSPASGAHWQAQPILFNKVKLTNNTLDSNGHIVLASMHKYQPRIHVIRTADLTQIPWAPQQAFVFPETEFVAVTAYQNDRITKLKIDNNPFAKGFRETGQSRCKRKMSSSPTLIDDQQQQQGQQARDNSTTAADDDHVSVSSQESQPLVKRMRSNGSAASSVSLLDDSFGMPPRGNHLGGPSFMDFAAHAAYYHHHQQQQHGPTHMPHLPNLGPQLSAAHLLQSHIGYLRPDLFAQAQEVYQRQSPPHHRGAFHDEADSRSSSAHTKLYDGESDEEPTGCDDEFVDVVSTATEVEAPPSGAVAAQPSSPQTAQQPEQQQQHTSPAATKSKCFSISSILGGNKEV